MFPAADDGIRQGFVRVINHSRRAGQVSIEAIDDESHLFGPINLAMDANETVHFNSTDVEEGNTSKGLSGGVGKPAAGDWRLRLSSGLDIEVLSYIRTPADGFLTAMHDLVPQEDNGRHRVAIFNPGSNRDQESSLRLINPNLQAAQVTITGIDEHGASPGGGVRLTLPAGAARTIEARELENGGSGLGGTLGDGAGKWQLRVESDRKMYAMSLLQSPMGHMTNLSTAPANVEDGVHTVPMFPAASDPRGHQGFARVINRSAESGDVTIGSFDDTERQFGTSRLELDAKETVHFNSDDLEMGNAAKGLTGAVGAGEGDWRLVLVSELDIEVLAYIRTAEGFLTAMHDTVPREGSRHRVAMFNPGSNVDQASLLRLVNTGDEAAEVEVTGIDGASRSSDGSVMVTVQAGTSRTLTAQELEAGGEGFDGKLGDGAGKWQLVVESEQPITVMSLLSSPTGHLTNLSTAPSLVYAPANGRVFDDRVVGMRLATNSESRHWDFPTPGRFRETVGTEVYEGDYRYTRTGPDVGTLVTDYNDGERCTAELAFRSRTAGTSTFTCDGGESDELEWWVAESPGGESGGGATRAEFEESTPSGWTTVTLRDDGSVWGIPEKYTDDSNEGTVAYMLLGTRKDCEFANAEVDESRRVHIKTETLGTQTGYESATACRKTSSNWDAWSGLQMTHLRFFDSTSPTNIREYSYNDASGEYDESTPSWSGDGYGGRDVYPLYDGVTVSFDTITIGGFKNRGCVSLPFSVDDVTFHWIAFQINGDDGWLEVDGTRNTGQMCPLKSTHPGSGTGNFRMVGELTRSDARRKFSSNTFEVEGNTIAADLVVHSASVDPGNASAGGRFTFSATVENQGEGDSGVTTLRHYRSSDSAISSMDTEVGTNAVPGLAAGTGSDQSISLIAPSSAGTYYYGACADAVSGESEVNNNCSVGVRVVVGDTGPQGSDFELAAGNESPAGIVYADGQFFVVNHNGSKVYAYETSGKRSSDSDFHLGVVREPEGIGYAEGRFYVVDGYDNHVFAFSASGVRDETVEFGLNADNRSPRGITHVDGVFYVVGGRPASNPFPAVVGQAYAYLASGVRAPHLDFDLDAENESPKGIGHGNGRFFVVDGVDDKVYAYAASGRREPLHDFDLNVANGSAEGIAYANGSFFVVNYWPHRKVYAYPEERADLVVESPTISDANPEPESSFDLLSVVRNSGNRPTPATTVRFYRSVDRRISRTDAEVGTSALDRLGASSESEQSIRLSLPQGCYFCGVCVDAFDGEYDTTNNCSDSIEFIVGEKLPSADLDISRLELHAPSPGNEGDPITMSVDVTNIGSIESSPAQLEFGDRYNILHIPALAPNETRSFGSVKVGAVSLGTTTYRVCITDGPCGENTANNCGSRSVTYLL